ncbi:MAG: TIGR02466 family protein [Boseongicola sp.]|nr:TIGR02466 family protein [Boseongicola sp.]
MPGASRYYLFMTTRSLFATRVYHARLPDEIDVQELEASCLSIAEDDEAGQRWCEENGFPGYTSYSSLADLPWRFPIFEQVRQALDRHVAAFAEELALDLGGRSLGLEDLWINILPEGGIHTSHIHPLSVISGTTYVAVPTGCAALKLEDPRLAMMMAAPPRKKHAAEELQQFVFVQPVVGDVLLWESWLRHEVPMNLAEDDRISVSFNYRWDT